MEQNVILTPPLSSPTEHTDRTEQVSESVSREERALTPECQNEDDTDDIGRI